MITADEARKLSNAHSTRVLAETYGALLDDIRSASTAGRFSIDFVVDRSNFTVVVDFLNSLGFLVRRMNTGSVDIFSHTEPNITHALITVSW